MLQLFVLGTTQNVWKVDNRRTYTEIGSSRCAAGITVKNTAADNKTLAFDKNDIVIKPEGMYDSTGMLGSIIDKPTRLKFNQKTLKPQIISGSKDKNFDVSVISLTAPKGYVLTDFFKEHARVYSVGSDYRSFVDFVMSAHNGGYVRVTFKCEETGEFLSYVFTGDEVGTLRYRRFDGTEKELRVRHPEITTKNFVIRKAQKNQPLTYIYKPSTPSRLILLEDVTAAEVKTSMADTGRCFTPDHYVFDEYTPENCDKYLAEGYTAVTVAGTTRTPACYGNFDIIQAFVVQEGKIFHYVG